ncbi:hypothetical protein ACNKHN_06970 [Shigella flexneri]
MSKGVLSARLFNSIDG